MKLSITEVEHIATLARLKLTEAEKEKYGSQLSQILAYMKKLQAVDTAGVEPTSQVTGLSNIMRSDDITESEIAAEIINGAPSQAGGYIKIPKIFENK